MSDQKPRTSPWPSHGIGDFADQFDGFAIDQWGVLHDGQQVYPGVVECLQQLVALGKIVVIITNSGKRASLNVERMAKMGIDPHCYTAMISSGEVTWSALKLRNDPFFSRLGQRCLFLSQGDDHSIVQGLDIELVSKVEKADFILLSGVEESASEKFYEHVIAHGSRYHLPLICANPDEIRITAKGLFPSCGAIARRYEALGRGEVRYIGKPYPEIYEFCRQVFGKLPGKRIVAIGDSLQHDIVGAAAAGLATAFVMGGIHRHELMDIEDAHLQQRRLRALARQHGVLPDWVLPTFKW